MLFADPGARQPLVFKHPLDGRQADLQNFRHFPGCIDFIFLDFHAIPRNSQCVWRVSVKNRFVHGPDRWPIEKMKFIAPALLALKTDRAQTYTQKSLKIKLFHEAPQWLAQQSYLCLSICQKALVS